LDCDFQLEVIESTKGRKKGRRKSKFTEALEQSTAKPVFDPEDKTFTEYVDEYYNIEILYMTMVDGDFDFLITGVYILGESSNEI
jgi:hypothetical protein